MTAKEYLSKLNWIKKEIDSLEEERAMLFNRTIRRANISDMKVQSRSSNNIYEQIGDYARTIEDKTDDLTKLQIKISEQINNIKDPNHRQILRYRYPIGLSWEEIAEVMCYNLRHIYKLHGEALISFKEANPDFANQDATKWH